MFPTLYLQQFGRALRGRFVHAQRARKLRRRGESPVFAGYSSTGKAMYRWTRGCITIEHAGKRYLGCYPIATWDEAHVVDEPGKKWTLDNTHTP